MRFFRTGLAAQSALYIAGGVNHFWHPAFYLRIMPDHYAHPEPLVQLTGWAELFGGVGLLIPATRRISAAGIVLMLFAFLDVHQFMLRHPQRFPDIPKWILWARLPVQFALIAAAVRYVRRPSESRLP